MNEQKNPLVSVLIVTYNRVSLLKNTLDSIINQTYANIEIIVVDDSLNTESEKLCKKYGNKIRYFHRIKRGGIPSAYNFGIEQIRGEWIKFLSDDNILFPESIQTLLNHVKSSQYSIMYSDYEYINDEGKEIGIHKDKEFSSYDDFVLAFWHTMPLNGETTLMHKSCLTKVGSFDTQFDSMSDYDWFLRACLIHKCSFVYVPKILLKFRLHTTQASHGDFMNSELLNRTRQKESLIKEKIRELIIEKDPEEWKQFESNLKRYEISSKKIINFLSESKFRKIYKILPYGLRISRKIWNKKIKSLPEFCCTVCKIQNRNSFIYGKPSTKYLTCPKCGTLFSKKHLSITK